MQEVLRFINIFQSPSNITLFKEIACYWFAVILHNRFEDSAIYYCPDSVHFATKIDGILYDISGVIEDEDDYFEFDDYVEYSLQQEITPIIENCIFFRGGE